MNRFDQINRMTEYQVRELAHECGLRCAQTCELKTLIVIVSLSKLGLEILPKEEEE